MKAQTHHIQACRNAWHDHYDKCLICCPNAELVAERGLCEQGAILYGEYQSAISAHRDLEELTATEADNETA